MKDLSLITKTKITADRVSQKLIDSFPFKMRVVQNDDGEIFLGFFPNEFYIVYDDSCAMDDPDCLYEQSEIDLIPFENPQVNEVYYHNENIAKYVINIVLEQYPELYINDEDNNFMPASEYLKKIS